MNGGQRQPINDAGAAKSPVASRLGDLHGAIESSHKVLSVLSERLRFVLRDTDPKEQEPNLDENVECEGESVISREIDGATRKVRHLERTINDLIGRLDI